MKASFWRVPLWIVGIVAVVGVYWSCGKSGLSSADSNSSGDGGTMTLSVGTSCRYLGPRYVCENWADVDAPLE